MPKIKKAAKDIKVGDILDRALGNDVLNVRKVYPSKNILHGNTEIVVCGENGYTVKYHENAQVVILE